MSDDLTLADGRDGEAMEEGAFLFLGLPTDVMLLLTRAAARSCPKTLMAVAQAHLDSVAEFGELGAHALAETPAFMAALVGGEEEQRFLARVVEKQADLLRGVERRFCFVQAISIYETLRDYGAADAGGEIDRLRALIEAAD